MSGLVAIRSTVYRQSSAIVHKQVAGVDAWQKVPNHVGFVSQQSIDKIGNLPIDNHRFCLQVCTKPNWHPVLFICQFWKFFQISTKYTKFYWNLIEIDHIFLHNLATR